MYWYSYTWREIVSLNEYIDVDQENQWMKEWIDDWLINECMNDGFVDWMNEIKSNK